MKAIKSISNAITLAVKYGGIIVAVLAGLEVISTKLNELNIEKNETSSKN